MLRNKLGLKCVLNLNVVLTFSQPCSFVCSRVHYHWNHEGFNAVQGTIITEHVRKNSGRTDLVLKTTIK